MKIGVQELMAQSGVAFGTSGARGLVSQMSDRVCWVYTRGFLQYLAASENLPPGSDVAIAGDLRPSTPRIMAAIADAVVQAGHRPVLCGYIPSPAVALHGLRAGVPAIMVTGSHIPADRNGIKFNKPTGEILKDDEAGIRAQWVEIPAAHFTEDGALRAPFAAALDSHPEAVRHYAARYVDFFGRDALRGRRIGVYAHSAVGRDVVAEVFAALGAEVTQLARSEAFVPVDTEAIRDEDVALARDWSREFGFDAIVSTDGDSDRPLIADETGAWLRGDIAGILCARFLGADAIATPVSCNTAVELCGWFSQVRRTRIGSPWVIAAMADAETSGATQVMGYEANGGFLLHSPVWRQGRMLAPLPTRDALIVLLALNVAAQEQDVPLSALRSALPQRVTASDRLANFATEKSRAIMAHFDSGDANTDVQRLEATFGALAGPLATVDRTDGLRMVAVSGDILHLRPSGNAPEFRCYTEADSAERAAHLNRACLAIVKTLSV